MTKSQKSNFHTKQSILTDPKVGEEFAKSVNLENGEFDKIKPNLIDVLKNKFIPNQLLARSIIIVYLPVLLAQVVIGFFFIEKHIKEANILLSEQYAKIVSVFVGEWQHQNRELSKSESPDKITPISELPYAHELNEQITNWAELFNFTIRVYPAGTPLAIPDSSYRFTLIRNTVPQALEKSLDHPFGLSILANEIKIETRVAVDDKVLAIRGNLNDTNVGEEYEFLLLMLTATILIQIASLFFLKLQLQPIRDLGKAATSWGKGDDSVQIKIKGAYEIRQASTAFITMRDRLQRYVEQRTSMLAGVSHDLRTILTRLKLGLAELSPTEEVIEMEADVDQMTRILQDYLDFSRGISHESITKVNIEEFLGSLIDRTPVGTKKVSYTCSGPREINTRELTLTRCLLNLLSNAVKHSTLRIKVTAEAHTKVSTEKNSKQGFLVIRVDDDGPGITEDDYDKVFEPFMRLQEGRNIDSHGSGLGLTIARDCARNLGGDIILSSSSFGGLSAAIYLPL